MNDKPKILMISWLPEFKFSSRLHLGFCRLLGTFFDYEYIYGGMLLDRHLTAEKTQILYEPDLVLHYQSFAPVGANRPVEHAFFKGFTCPKIMIEVDFQYALFRDPIDWYKKSGFDLVLTRGWHEKEDLDKIDLPYAWLPWSVDLKEFDVPDIKRYPLIGFAGALAHPVYAARQKAVTMLDGEDLLLRGTTHWNLPSQKVYPKFLRKVSGALHTMESFNNKGEVAYNSIKGKLMEIMATKTTALTHPLEECKVLFNGTPWVEFKIDTSDLIDKAHEAIDDINKAEEAYRQINLMHTHEIRIKELKDHIFNILEKGETEQVWGR